MDVKAKLETVNQRLRGLAAEAVSDDGRIDREKLIEVRDLRELQNLLTSYMPSREPRRLRIIVALLTGLLVITLVLTRLSSVDVAFYGSLSSLRFTLANEALLGKPIKVGWLSIENYDRVLLPARSDVQAQLQGTKTVKLESLDEGALELSIPVMPQHASVEIVSHATHYEFVLCGQRKPVRVNILAPVAVYGKTVERILTPGSLTALFTPLRMRNVPDSAIPGNETTAACNSRSALKIRFLPRDDAFLELNPYNKLEAIDFYRLQRTQSGSPIPRPSLVEAELTMPSVGDKAVSLKRNDYIELDILDAEIQSLTLDNGLINIGFFAELSGLRKGKPFDKKSIMPYWIEWWFSQELVFVAWSLGVSVFGFIFAVRRWVLS